MQQNIDQNLSSFRDETSNERLMRVQILGLSQNQRNVLQNTINELNDPILFCDQHYEIYIFHDDQKFYCKKCVTPQITGLKLINLNQNDDSQNKILDHFQAIDDKRNNIILDEDTLQQRIEQLGETQPNQSQDTINIDPLHQELDLNKIDRILRNRKRFIQIQEFISHIPLDIRNRPHHNELHINDTIDFNEEYIFYDRIQNAKIRYNVDELVQKLLSGLPQQQQQN